MWVWLLKMLGKGPPVSGDSFTTLSAMATPGKRQSFDAKTQAGAVQQFFYYLKHIAGF